MKCVVFLLSLVASAGSASAQDVEIKNGFVSGRAYSQMSAPQRSAYAMGVVEGMFLSPFFGGEKSKVIWLETCATGMSDTQLVAVLDQYVRGNPVRWHESMHALAFSALKQACQHAQPDA